jgi:hypothetical protein
MPKRYKPGDILTARVVAVELGFMRVDLDGTKLDLEMPVKPMSRKMPTAQIQKITRTWGKHYGVNVNFRLGKLVE